MEEGVQFPTHFEDLETMEDEEQTGSELNHVKKAKVPTLIDLCSHELRNQLLLDDFVVEDLYELPTHLFEPVVKNLPAAALEKLEQKCKQARGLEELGDGNESSDHMKRFRSSGVFNEAWRNLFEIRFSTTHQSLGLKTSDWESSDDWMQAYWERHLQECIDLATEQVFRPSYKGNLSQMHVSTKLLELIGYKDTSSPPMSEYMTLSYHCRQFGKYARCLRIRNVICTPEICDILKTCELRSLILRRIRTNKEVDALCEFLKQNMRSLRSLHFIDSALLSSDVERICHSLCFKDLGTHLLQDLLVMNSRLPDPNGCEPFLCLGRSLKSISIINTVICEDFANSVLKVLINTSSSVEYLNLSDNNTSGWFSKLKLIKPINSLKSLRKLTLRGNNMRKTDVDDLKSAIRFLPNLDALDLKDNPIGDEGIRNLISCILGMAERNAFLKHLNLDNCLLSCDGATRLLDTLSSLTNQLLSLSIADNNLGSHIAAPLSRFLSTSILDLNIELTGLGASGFNKLEQGIGESLQLQLRNINMSRNCGKFATAKIISKLITNAPQLQTIKAAQNLMLPESMLEVCSLLKHKKGVLKMVDLSGNIYDPSLDAVRRELIREGKGKPLVVLPSFHTGPFIHDDDP